MFYYKMCDVMESCTVLKEVTVATVVTVVELTLNYFFSFDIISIEHEDEKDNKKWKKEKPFNFYDCGDKRTKTNIFI